MSAGAPIERDVVIVACAVSAGIHAALAPEHLAEGAAAGAGFAASAVLLAALAVALTRRGGPAALAAAAVLFAGLIGSYALAVTTGVPILHPGAEPVEGLALTTKAVELVGLLAAAHLLRRGSATVRPIPLGLTALIACFSAFTALAASQGHSHDGGAHAGPALTRSVEAR